MSDDLNSWQRRSAQPSPDLSSLNRLVGTWVVSGEAQGTVHYEWAEGGFFLLQHVDLGGIRGLEVIGRERRYGEDPSRDIRSRYYGFFEGETLDYTYEVRTTPSRSGGASGTPPPSTRARSARTVTPSRWLGTIREVADIPP